MITAEYWGEAGIGDWCDVRWMVVTFALVVPLIQLPDYHAMAAEAAERHSANAGEPGDSTHYRAI